MWQITIESKFYLTDGVTMFETRKCEVENKCDLDFIFNEYFRKPCFGMKFEAVFVE